MIRQLFKLVWNRRHANALVMIEMLVCFIVLCFVLTTVAGFTIRWNEPLGFRYEDVWHVHIQSGSYFQASEEERIAVKRGLGELEIAIAKHKEVRDVGLCGNAPFSSNSSVSTIYIDGGRHGLLLTHSSLSLIDVLGLELIDGRWIEEGDEALAWTPMVISRLTADGLFPNGQVLGERLPSFDREGQQVEYEDLDPEIRGDEYRIVGIVEDIKRAGEVGSPAHIGFVPSDLASARSFPPSNLLIRVQPGTTAQFEEGLMKSLHELQPEWSFQVSTLTQARRGVLRSRFLPLAIASVVAVSLIAMVGMGLVGVLWQNVVRRTQELGLRRALGATALQVQLQIMGELGALAVLSLLFGTVLFLQVPFLFPGLGMSLGDCLLGLVAATFVTTLFVAACSFYPSWLAARIQPSQALQYE